MPQTGLFFMEPIYHNGDYVFYAGFTLTVSMRPKASFVWA